MFLLFVNLYFLYPMRFYKNYITGHFMFSNYKKPFFYYLEETKLLKVDLLGSKKSEVIRHIDTIDFLSLDFINNDIILVYKDKIVWNDIPLYILVKKYFIYGSSILVLNTKNQLIILTSKTSLILAEDIKDFTIKNDFIWLVDCNNKIYRKYFYESIISLNISSPLSAVKMSSGLSIQFIEINKYVYLFYKSSIEVYEFINNILILKYVYNTKDYKYFNCNKLYVVDKDTLILDEYPSLIIKGRVSCVFKDNEEDILINNENIIKNNKVVKDIKNELATSTFKTLNLVDNLKTTFVIDSTNEKNIFNKFDEEVLDRYRKFYYELVTTNESLILKKEKLQELYTKINKKIKSQDERKNKIKMRLEEVTEKYEKILSKVKIDGKSIYNYINILKNLLEKDKKCYEEKYLKILKIQNNFLKKKIFRQY